jgi:hypothetical protein
MSRWPLLTVATLATFAGSPSQSRVLTVERGSNLQSVIDFAVTGDTIVLAANKTFEAKPIAFTDPLCGNCQDPKLSARASYGFIIKDKALTIIGQDRQTSKLVTLAGYGVYVENSDGSILKNLTITGGKRDADGNATDAGVVVRNSKLRIESVDIRDNTNRIDSVVVGIGGVHSREGAEVVIADCNIINNTWDGVALYRGAIVTVTDCVIKDGRGAGIGVTWDGTCVAYRNDVSGFWKGIGSFGTSTVIARNNLVHDNLGWGIIATGASTMEASNNVVYHNGNCGIAPWSTEARGRFINNIIAENGWRDQWVCPCVGVWNYGDWAKWRFNNNIVWHNKAGEYQDIWDQTGMNGNLNVDPKFVADGSFRLSSDSPGLHAGDSTVYNIDGSVSHVGLWGGPQARRQK